MPRRNEHVRDARLIFGGLSDIYEWVHAIKDYPSRWLGPRHRVLGHGVFENIRLGFTVYLLTGDLDTALNAMMIGFFHDGEDYVDTWYKLSARSTRRRWVARRWPRKDDI